MLCCRIVYNEIQFFHKDCSTYFTLYIDVIKYLFYFRHREIEKTYQIDDAVYEVPTYILCPTEGLVEEIRKYIMSKHPFENAQHDRECNTEKLSKETGKHYKETIEYLSEHFQDVLEIMEKQFYTTLNFQKTHTVMLDNILQNQDENKTIDTGIFTKLEVIHTNVEKTNENQIVLMNASTEIKEDVNAIKIYQGIVSEKQDNLQKTTHEWSLGDELREILRKTDPGPSIRKEVKRFFKKL